ncbi:factor in the germline alpha [Ctenodactylus gundi]
MDAAPAPPALLGAPPAEVLQDALLEQFGPLPQLAAVCRLKRLPAGGYSATEDLQLVLERRRAANAKERERIKNLNRGFAKLKALVPFLPQNRKPSKVDILKGAIEYIQVLSDVLEGAKDLEKQDPDKQNYSNNASEPRPFLAREPSKTARPTSGAVGLKNEKSEPWADGGSGEPAYACHQSMPPSNPGTGKDRTPWEQRELGSTAWDGNTQNASCCRTETDEGQQKVETE